jgi:hypothetical protein
MNYFKNNQNQIFAYDDEQVSQGYGKDLTPITEQEAMAIANPLPTTEQVKQTKANEIDTKAQQHIDSLVPVYPEFEKLTFEKQEQEARAYLADNTLATPTLTSIATERGLTVLELATRVVAKSDQFTQLAATVAGKRQAYHDQLANAVDVDGVNAIVVNY